MIFAMVVLNINIQKVSKKLFDLVFTLLCSEFIPDFRMFVT